MPGSCRGRQGQRRRPRRPRRRRRRQSRPAVQRREVSASAYDERAADSFAELLPGASAKSSEGVHPTAARGMTSRHDDVQLAAAAGFSQVITGITHATYARCTNTSLHGTTPYCVERTWYRPYRALEAGGDPGEDPRGDRSGQSDIHGSALDPHG